MHSVEDFFSNFKERVVQQIDDLMVFMEDMVLVRGNVNEIFVLFCLEKELCCQIHS